MSCIQNIFPLFVKKMGFNQHNHFKMGVRTHLCNDGTDTFKNKKSRFLSGFLFPEGIILKDFLNWYLKWYNFYF